MPCFRELLITISFFVLANTVNLSIFKRSKIDKLSNEKFHFHLNLKVNQNLQKRVIFNHSGFRINKCNYMKTKMRRNFK